ncbi:MAG: hypothetical protein MUC96_27975 [Myxococcaceae bacterium]|nr:hypothetical protein [Myxococcaceae bacterium]
MIPVAPAPEPASFDAVVRRPGRTWLTKHKTGKLKPYWASCLDELWLRYHGVCAYLATHFERVTGAASVEHFVAKSSARQLAYEWSNYRLASRDVNGRKSDFDDVLDPFELEPDTFRLVLVLGQIVVNPSLRGSRRQRAADTIERLGLDRPLAREMRARHFEELHAGRRLPHDSPFVWAEMQRQAAPSRRRRRA